MKEAINRLVKKSEFLSWIKYKVFCHKWKKINRHNFTIPINCFNRKKVHIGKGTYGKLDVRHFGLDEESLYIGNYCSIGPECTFLLGGEHRYDSLSTYPFRMKYIDGKNESISKGPIVVEDDVWIGFGTTVMSGVKIGKGAVIAAGSVVVKDIPPYAIAAGVPAKVIKYRFDEKVIEKIKEINMVLLDEQVIRDNIEIFEKEVNETNVDDICKRLNNKDGQ